MPATARKKGPATEARDVIGLRVPKAQLAEIDRRAKRLRLTRTEYMIRASLGEVLDPRSLDERVAELEQRVAAIESAVGKRQTKGPHGGGPH